VFNEFQTAVAYTVLKW